MFIQELLAKGEVGNPFPGLRPFEESDNILFFGRDEQVEALLERLRERRFVAVVGTSASGKSSLVRAGLLPALHGGFMVGAGARWRIAVLRPGNAPTANLAAALEGAGALGTEGGSALRAGLAQSVLEAGERGLIEVVAQSGLGTDENVLIVVDQFEELFRYNQDRDGAAAFVKLLLAAAADTAVPTYILVTMRSDYLGDCSQFRDLPETINEGLFLVPRLTRDELREAIEGPIGVADGEITPLLVNHLLNAIGDSPDQLPVLQHALMRTWEVWTGAGSTDAIGIDDFEAIGGLSHALNKHGESLYEGLPPRLHPVAEKLFKALTDSGSDNRGIRRPTPLVALPGIVGASAADVAEVVEEFRGTGRSFMTPAGVPLDAATVVDIAHESLMRIWDRLQTWVQEEADSAQAYRRLADAAQLYAKGELGLMYDPQLSLAKAWRERNAPTAEWAERIAPGFAAAMAYLDASIAEHERQRLEAEERERYEREIERRKAEAEEAAKLAVLEHQAEMAQTRARAATQLTHRTRRYLLLMSFVAVIAVGLGIYALVSQLAAASERADALRSQSRFLARDAEGAVSQGDAVTGMLLALAALPKDVAHPTDRPFVHRAEAALQDAYSNQRELKDLNGSGSAGYAYAAVFSTDGRTIVSGSSDKAVHVWDAATGAQLHRFVGHTDTVRAVAISPDGRTIASGSDDQTVRLWDAATGKVLRVLRGHTARINSVAFSPDGRSLISAASDQTVRIWDVPSGTVRHVLIGHTGIVFSAVFSRDGTRIASASDDKTARIWDSATGTLVKTLRGNEDIVLAVAFSPNGRQLLTSSLDKTVRLWEISSGKQLRVLRGHESYVIAVAFSPDGKHVLSASGDKTIRLWDLDGDQIGVLRSQSGLTSAAFSANGNRIVGTYGDATIRIWDASSNVVVLRGHTSYVMTAAFSRDGTRLVSGSVGHTVRIWDVNRARQLSVFLFPSSVQSVAFSPDGRHVLAASGDQYVRVVDATTGRPVVPPWRAPKPVASAAFSPNGRQIVVALADGRALVLDATTFAQIHVLKGHTLNLTSAVFSPDGTRIVTASADKTARIWNASTGAQLKVLNGHTDRVQSAAFSPDGTKVVTASYDQTVRTWDVASGNQLSSFGEHTDRVLSAAYSPDGQRIVSGSADLTVRISDTAGRQISVLRGHADSVWAVAFSPDRKHLASASWDDTLRIWNIGGTEESGQPLINDATAAVNAIPRSLSDAQKREEFLSVGAGAADTTEP